MRYRKAWMWPTVRLLNVFMIEKMIITLPSELLTECLSEGPCLARAKDSWFLFYDYFGIDAKYKVKMSKDFINWTDVTDKVNFPVEHIKHVSIMEI